MKPSRRDFLLACRAVEGVPYIWGGKAPPGLDCSGLVTWALKVAGGADVRATHNSDKLWFELDPASSPRAGDLAFYGPNPGDPNHVVVLLGSELEEIIGANGGNMSTTTLEAAQVKRACVNRKPTPRYRGDFLGFRSMTKYLSD